MKPHRLFFPCLFLLSLPMAVSGQSKQAMTMIDLLNVPSLSDPQMAPDGSQLLYVLGESDWEKSKQIRHIWRIEADGTNTLRMTGGGAGESSPRWSPDGQWIAFLAKREDDEGTQIYLMRNAGGEAQKLMTHETAVSSIAWHPDGASIYFLASEPKSAEEKAKDKVKDDVFAFEENYKQRHFWTITIEDKQETRITEGDYSLRGYNLSRDGTRVAYHKAPTPLLDDGDEAEVWVMDIDGKNRVQLTDNMITEGGASLSPDNRQVLFTAGANADFETYYNRNLFLVPATGGKARPLIPDFPYGIQRARWGQDANTIYLLVNMGVHSEIMVVDVGKKTYAPLTSGEHSLGGWQYDHKADRHTFTINKWDNPGDVWTQAGTGATKQITRVFDYLANDFQLPTLKNITWKGEDGVTIEGLLFYPLDYQEGARYPLVAQTHGGPASSDRFRFGRWSNYVQILTSKGYAVFKPNYRGSTGYGNAFLRDMVNHYFKNAHLDVMAGVDHLIKEGIVDPDRMVKMGWSAGGHMTNKIITFTDRFKAASSGAGAVNWISMYAQSDVRIYRTPWFGGTPWQKDAPTDVYWEHSPLKDIVNVKTPTLILVGQNDERVPPQQSIELYRALKSNGVPTHLYMAPRTGHGWSELRHRLFKMNIEMEWFEKYAMDRIYMWEKNPEDDKEEPEEETIQ